MVKSKEYKSFIVRIVNANSTRQLERLEISLNRLYTYEIFSADEFRDLDVLLMDKAYQLS